MRRDKAKRLLAKELQELNAIIDHTEHEETAYREENSVEAGHDTADHGSDLTTVMEHSLSLDVATSRRDQVLAAQQRLEDGSYGRCLDCGEKIPDERLEALPHAERCVDDQEKADRLAHL